MHEGGRKDFGLARFKPVRSAVRENALWSLVILCSHETTIMGDALKPTINALKSVVQDDLNTISVGFAMDALNRLANLQREDEAVVPPIRLLKAELLTILRASPIQSWDTLVRGGLGSTALSDFDQPA